MNKRRHKGRNKPRSGRGNSPRNRLRHGSWNAPRGGFTNARKRLAKHGTTAAVLMLCAVCAFAGWQTHAGADSQARIAALHSEIATLEAELGAKAKWPALPPAHVTWDRLAAIVANYHGVVLHKRGMDGARWKGALSGEARLVYALAHALQRHHRLALEFSAIEAHGRAELGFLVHGSH